MQRKEQSIGRSGCKELIVELKQGVFRLLIEAGVDMTRTAGSKTESLLIERRRLFDCLEGLFANKYDLGSVLSLDPIASAELSAEVQRAYLAWQNTTRAKRQPIGPLEFVFANIDEIDRRMAADATEAQ